MQDSFDPYLQWLGIPPAQQPANYYQLLGVAPFEADPATIDVAAAACIARVRTLSQGRYQDLAERLIGEICQARDTLEQPDQKLLYDRRLQELAARPPSAPAPSAAPIPVVPGNAPPSVVVVPTATAPAAVAAGPTSPVVAERIRRASSRKRSPVPLVLCCVGGLALLLVAALLFLPWQAFQLEEQPGDPPSGQAAVARQSRTRRSASRSSPRRSAQAAVRAQERWRPLPSQRPLGPPTLADLLEQADQTPNGNTKKKAASTPATVASSPSPNSPPTPDESKAATPTTEPPRAKMPVPEGELSSKAAGKVRSLLQEEYLLADNPEKRIALAQRLLALGEQAAGEPVVRYACFSLALEQAAKVGDPQQIDQVVERLAQDYDVDAMCLRAETMAAAWRSDYSIPHRMDLYKQSQALLAAALSAKNYAAAGHAIRVAMAGARAAKDYRLLRELEQQRDMIRAADKTPET